MNDGNGPERLVVMGGADLFEVFHVTLTDGSVIDVNAWAFSQDGDQYVFEMLVAGDPRPVSFPLVWIPSAIVRNVWNDEPPEETIAPSS